MIPRVKNYTTRYPTGIYKCAQVGIRLLGDPKFGREVDRAEDFLRNPNIPFELVKVIQNPDDEDWDT